MKTSLSKVGDLEASHTLLNELRSHIAQMASYQRERRSGQLLIMAADKIAQLLEQLSGNQSHPTKSEATA